LTDEIKTILQKTLDEDPLCIDSLEQIEASLAAGNCIGFAVKTSDKIYGAAIISFEKNTQDKLLMNLSLLGGEDVRLWINTLMDFLLSVRDQTNSKLIIASRCGWKKVYPRLRVIGSIYTVD
jgi:hypothetical protein